MMVPIQAEGNLKQTPSPLESQRKTVKLVTISHPRVIATSHCCGRFFQGYKCAFSLSKMTI